MIGTDDAVTDVMTERNHAACTTITLNGTKNWMTIGTVPRPTDKVTIGAAIDQTKSYQTHLSRAMIVWCVH